MADALISPAVGGVMWAASAGALAWSTAKIKNELGEKKLPVMAVAGAFVFAAQMINFTIPATGSSGHIGGGILLAGFLGPAPALLTIAAVLLVQALFFADGGLLAFGCNVFNMGVIPCLLAYPFIFKPLAKNFKPGRIALAASAAVIAGLPLGAFFVVLETLISGITALPFGTFVLLMLPIHIAIAVGEAAATSAVLIFVHRMRPEILESSASGALVSQGVPVKRVVVALGAAALITGALLSLFASAYPDGLEWSIEKVTGSTELEAEGAVYAGAGALQETTSFMPDYNFKGAGEDAPPVGASVAGIVGALITCVLAGGIGFVISAAKRKKAQAA
ncbi:MAG: energy-coupling factor ABC transporter permease [Treponema sp.]|nr:energy-coupling factor ABC transporter permease [Treponema sp.]